MNFLTISCLLSFIASTACPFQKTLRTPEVTFDSPASDQLSAVWSAITMTNKSSPWPSFAIPRLLLEDMKPSMNAVTDTMPSGRVKLVHSVGVIAKAKFDSTGTSKYSGLFEGANFMLIRLSLATDPGRGKDGIVPSISFKIFRSYTESANVVAMWSLTGQESYNFFANDFSNHISIKGAPSLIVNKFATASTWASHVGLSHLASKGQDGKLVKNVKTPFQLIFRPMNGVATSEKNEGIDVFDQIVTKIQSGTQLYSVWAAEIPGIQFTQIGIITTESEFVRSAYADQTLFFKHQKFEEDLAMNQEWLQNCSDVNNCETCHSTKSCVFK